MPSPPAASASSGTTLRSTTGTCSFAPWALAQQPMQIGRVTVSNRVFVAPMAGVTDRPYRQLCKKLGAGYVVAEMAASNPKLWNSVKTARRTNHQGETLPTSVQLAGSDPHMMAEAAKFNVDRGAQIIDINMGCPAKKVCNVWAGSALMQNLDLAEQIIEAVCKAVDVPVTVKMRTGPTPDSSNAADLARRAEKAGAQMIAVHARSRACAYVGQVNYAVIAQVKNAVQIPVVANGDIDSPEKALKVLQLTGADAIMIGRAAQGRPWLPGQVAHYLSTGKQLAAPDFALMKTLMQEHLHDHYQFYGDEVGVRSARKHIAWYLDDYLPSGTASLQNVFSAQDPGSQWLAVNNLFDQMSENLDDSIVALPGKEYA